MKPILKILVPQVWRKYGTCGILRRKEYFKKSGIQLYVWLSSQKHDIEIIHRRCSWCRFAWDEAPLGAVVEPPSLNVGDIVKSRKKLHGTEGNTFEMFPVESRVRVITVCQDFTFLVAKRLVLWSVIR